MNGTQPVAPLEQSNSADELPAWLRDTEPAPAITASSSNSLADPADAASEDQLPAWLQTSPTPTSAVQQGDSGLPAWLADTAETGQPTNLGTSASAAGSLPDWLLDDSTSPAAETEKHQAQIYNTTAPSDIPAWLADTPSNDTSEPEVEVPVPNWANEFGEDPSAAAPHQIGLQDTEELPSWLNDASPAPAPAPQAHSEVDGLPAWLVEESPTSAPTSATTQSNLHQITIFLHGFRTTHRLPMRRQLPTRKSCLRGCRRILLILQLIPIRRPLPTRKSCLHGYAMMRISPRLSVRHRTPIRISYLRG
jgi:hypothetical protein